MFELMIEDKFAAAHQLVGYEGPCENLHGHTWKVQVFLKGEELGSVGMLYDFKEAKKVLKDILKAFDHKNLNETAPFGAENPTAENLAKRIYNEYSSRLKGLPGAGVRVDRTSVWESETTCATYRS